MYLFSTLSSTDVRPPRRPFLRRKFLFHLRRTCRHRRQSSRRFDGWKRARCIHRHRPRRKRAEISNYDLFYNYFQQKKKLFLKHTYKLLQIF